MHDPSHVRAAPNLETIEIKAHLPAKDFEVSLRFYADLGFAIPWNGGDLAYVQAGRSSFLLQRFYEQAFAENLMMHMLVADVEAWWQRVLDQSLQERYGVTAQPPEDRAWGIRDFVLIDPSGVLWRIGQEIVAVSAATLSDHRP